jgi:Domain of unknown function (DUF4159)
MRFGGVLYAVFPSLALLSAVCSTVPLPDQERLPNDTRGIGSRTSRQAQQPGTFREYPGWEYNDYPIPRDFNVPGEWAFARFMYRAVPTWRGRLNNWTIDYPRSDRHLSAAVRRLTRIQARSVEEPIAAEDGDDIYNWPWLYAVEVGHWDLTDLQAAKLRDYLERGGFFMCDDFHGTVEWETFVASMKKVLPNRPIVDLPDNAPIFHTVYDLSDRYQVPGEQFVYSHRTFEKDGFEPRWRGIYDDKGRVIVAICHNMDLGDSWEHADNPLYPEQYSALGFRIGINYLVYSMTH